MKKSIFTTLIIWTALFSNSFIGAQADTPPPTDKVRTVDFSADKSSTDLSKTQENEESTGSAGSKIQPAAPSDNILDFNFSSINWGQEYDLKTAFDEIKQLTKLNVVFEDGVEKNSSATLSGNNIKLRTVLKNVLFEKGYSYSVKDDTIYVFKFATRVFDIVVPPVTGSFSNESSNESTMAEAQGSTAGVSAGNIQTIRYESAKLNFLDSLLENVRQELSEHGKVSVNRLSGQIIVTDTSSRLEKIAYVIDSITQSVLRQARFDIKIVEINKSHEFFSGINWDAVYNQISPDKYVDVLKSNLNLLQDFTKIPTMKVVGGIKPISDKNLFNNLDAVLDLHEKAGTIKIQHQPYITTLNNFPASVLIGGIQSIVEKIGSETSANFSNTSTNTKELQDGVALSLTPRIMDGCLSLHINTAVQKIKEIIPFEVDGKGTKVQTYKKDVVNFSTNFSMKDGDTVSIGGFLKDQKADSERRTPLLHAIPVLGWLFKGKEKVKDNTEIVVFVTAHIIEANNHPEPIRNTKPFENPFYSRQNWLHK